jgi:hypothetical protein
MTDLLAAASFLGVAYISYLIVVKKFNLDALPTSEHTYYSDDQVLPFNWQLLPHHLSATGTKNLSHINFNNGIQEIDEKQTYAERKLHQ